MAKALRTIAIVMFVSAFAGFAFAGEDAEKQALQDRVAALEAKVQDLETHEPGTLSDYVRGVAAAAIRPDAKQKKGDNYAREYAADAYTGSSSHYWLHGYGNVVWQEFQRDFQNFTQNNFPTGPGGAAGSGQPNIANTENATFLSEFALHLGSTIKEGKRNLAQVHFEQHYYQTGQVNPVTQANVSWWPLAEKDELKITGGLFWSPFATVADDWQTTSNLFGMLPSAGQAIPWAPTEVGLKADGHLGKGNIGINWTAAMGNGTTGFDTPDRTAFDTDQNKNFTARAAIVPHAKGSNRLEAGLSYMWGSLRDTAAGRAAAGGVGSEVFDGELMALAVDGVFRAGPIRLRGFAITSTESLDKTGGVKPNVDDLNRQGLMAEGALCIAKKLPIFGEAWLKGRFDTSNVEVYPTVGTVAPKRDDVVIAVGANLHPNEHVVIKGEYWFIEDDQVTPGQTATNNGILLSLGASF